MDWGDAVNNNNTANGTTPLVGSDQPLTSVAKLQRTNEAVKLGQVITCETQ
jgi:hypothetical protein